MDFLKKEYLTPDEVNEFLTTYLPIRIENKSTSGCMIFKGSVTGKEIIFTETGPNVRADVFIKDILYLVYQESFEWGKKMEKERMSKLLELS